MTVNGTMDMFTNVSNKSLEMINQTGEWRAPDFDGSFRNITLAIVLGILVILTIFGNLLVILSFVFERRLLQPFNMYILNLAITDFLVATTAMTLCTVDTILGYWPFGVYLCGMWIYFDYAMTFASVFTLVAISVDRFWCVTWPLHFKARNTNKKTAIILGVVWFCVIAIWTPPFIKDRLSHKEPHSCVWVPANNKDLVIFVDVVGYYLPCTIIILCYIRVFVVMRRQQTAFTELPNAIPTVCNAEIKRSPPIDTQSYNQPTKGNNQRQESSRDSKAEDEYSSVTGHACMKNDYVVVKNDFVTSDFSTDWKSNDWQPATPRRDLRQTYRQFQRERRIFITLSCTLLIYIVCWFPFYVTFDISAWHPHLVPEWLYNLFFWSTYVNSTLNPIVYAYANKEFRTAFKKVQKRVCLFNK